MKTNSQALLGGGALVIIGLAVRVLVAGQAGAVGALPAMVGLLIITYVVIAKYVIVLAIAKSIAKSKSRQR